MKRTLEIIGAILFVLGVSSADSELLFIPFSLVAMGMAFIFVAERSK